MNCQVWGIGYTKEMLEAPLTASTYQNPSQLFAIFGYHIKVPMNVQQIRIEFYFSHPLLRLISSPNCQSWLPLSFSTWPGSYNSEDLLILQRTRQFRYATQSVCILETNTWVKVSLPVDSSSRNFIILPMFTWSPFKSTMRSRGLVTLNEARNVHVFHTINERWAIAVSTAVFFERPISVGCPSRNTWFKGPSCRHSHRVSKLKTRSEAKKTRFCSLYSGPHTAGSKTRGCLCSNLHPDQRVRRHWCKKRKSPLHEKVDLVGPSWGCCLSFLACLVPNWNSQTPEKFCGKKSTQSFSLHLTCGEIFNVLLQRT